MQYLPGELGSGDRSKPGFVCVKGLFYLGDSAFIISVVFLFVLGQVVRCDYNALLSAFLLFQDVIVLLTVFASGRAGRSNTVLKRRSAKSNSVQRP